MVAKERKLHCQNDPIQHLTVLYKKGYTIGVRKIGKG